MSISEPAAESGERAGYPEAFLIVRLIFWLMS